MSFLINIPYPLDMTEKQIPKAATEIWRFKFFKAIILGSVGVV